MDNQQRFLKRVVIPQSDSESSRSRSSSCSRSRRRSQSRRKRPRHSRNSQERSRRGWAHSSTHTHGASHTSLPSTSRLDDDGGTSVNALVSTLLEFMQNMKKDSNHERFPGMNVIPEFDPCKRNQTIHTWLSKVNESASIYGWTDKQTAYYALPKLVGLAKRWYQGLPSVKFSWSEWEYKLASAFPSEQNFGQLLTEMLVCKAQVNDSLEEYFYEKMVLLNRCKISGKDAIDCILFGIEDGSIRASAEAAQFREPDKLLAYLRNVKSKTPAQALSGTNLVGTSDSLINILGEDFGSIGEVVNNDESNNHLENRQTDGSKTTRNEISEYISKSQSKQKGRFDDKELKFVLM
ncbi:uncharacterized protein LOC123880536 [Maniola jurtina]|uniref:uncharacterized protein LOC123880536 n=1 Tax=Maniola jurtina TaxID=191418 RepID=UPI001E68A1A0|nr:uncharacterized protein LOC123880536 [Maniola jurtina]